MFNLTDNENFNELNNDKKWTLNIEDLLKINNIKLNKILNYVNDKPVLFSEDLKLLCKREIENFEEEFLCKIDGLVPLIDVSNNDYIVYICKSNTFGMYNIVDELLFNEDYDVDEIIKQLEDYYN